MKKDKVTKGKQVMKNTRQRFLEWLQKLEKHAKFAKDRGWCVQCQYPWHDGTCECGNDSNPKVEKALKLALAHDNWREIMLRRTFPIIPGVL
jgi:hypothetical protein